MNFSRLVVILGMVLMIASCTTDKYGETFYGFSSTSTNTTIGEKYLLGRGVKQDNKRAFYYFSQAAAKGDLVAQNELGFMYAAGKGTPRNYGKAFVYYHQAASKGLSSAQYNLGLLYLHGLGTPVNKPKAIEWFKRSADAGFEPARVALTRYNT